MLNFLAKAPGKVLLTGEYAVLCGGQALSLSLGSYFFAKLVPKSNNLITLKSNLWSETQTFNLLQKEDLKKSDCLFMKIVFFAIQAYSLKRGFELSVSSEFKIKDGLGSSSALILTSLAVLKLYSNHLKKIANRETLEKNSLHFIDWSLLQDALLIQKNIQGFASGYDLSTQFSGDAIIYQKPDSSWPPKITRPQIPKSHWNILHLFVGGQGAPTKEVGTKTLKVLKNLKLEKSFYEISQNLFDLFLKILRQGSLSDQQVREPFFQKIEKHRSILKKSPYFPNTLHQILSAKPGYGKTWSYKTTGSGGEDALLLIGLEKDIQTATKTLEQINWFKLKTNFLGNGLSFEEKVF